MSQYGKLKHIVDLETLLGYTLNKVDFSDITNDNINYSWGDESELKKWIVLKDEKTSTSGNFYNISGSLKIPVSKQKKYPLIWLVTPVEGRNESQLKSFKNVTIIICENTTEESLNADRWRDKIPTLQAITDKIIDSLRGDLKIAKDRGVLQYSYRNVPKYSIKENGGGKDASKTIDI